MALIVSMLPAPAQRGGEGGNSQAPAVTRRIITKVDGVVVEERDSTPGSRPTRIAPPPSPATHPGPWLYQPIEPETEKLPPTDPVIKTEHSTAPEDDEGLTADEAEEDEDEDSPGFFGRLFAPASERSAEPAGPRLSKRRGARMRTETPATSVAVDTNEEPDSGENDPLAKEADTKTFPERRLIVGEVVSVNPDNGTAVIWLATRHLVLPGKVITRNHEMETTATLEPTTLRGGRALGMEIISGRPRMGDEVVFQSGN